jgi:hypothetical protein
VTKTGTVIIDFVAAAFTKKLQQRDATFDGMSAAQRSAR